MLALFWLLLFIVGAGFFVACGTVWFYMSKWEFRDSFNILCPETLQPAAVKIDGDFAARTRFAGREELLVTSCSRWPERQRCDQTCTPQVPLVGDDRSRTQIAAFGLHPKYIRINNPVYMTRELYDKVTAQTASGEHRAAA